MRLLIPILGLAGLAGCATADTAQLEAARAERDARADAELTKALKGRVQSGEPTDCITLHQARSSTTIRDRAVVYEMAGDMVYVNNFQGGCAGLNDTKAIITRSTTSQLCRGDIATVTDLVAGFSTGSCIFGDFVPYRKPR
ncbi:DUF6491 family protein [Sphingomonas sp. LaA6.9]|uniref:DUF6491 family protein n=1 Tax=Sphingomonas sp. LaA6.9 TaxID=2919914 RepID=UPI001F4FE9FB|nr:DUF6491 family protein [Sphingomonas sp. LaA6.9]MCJ8158022.1 DUF6491 family protein [Sphingomonas sp. LaA6.9]